MIAINPKSKFKFNGSAFNVYHADANEGLPKHYHDYEHATVVHAGRVVLRKKDLEVELTKDSMPVLLKKNQWHEIEAVEDGTVFVNIFKDGVENND